MSEGTNLMERCQSFIDSNFVKSPTMEKRKPLTLAISRQAFSQSHAIAEELIRLLQADENLGQDEWALFDQDLVHKILQEHDLPEAIERYMPEDRDHEFTGLINEILGVHPSSWKLFHYTCDTIHKLARVGNVILIGRGSHLITREMSHVLTVRIIAPFPTRVHRAEKLLEISHEEAVKRIRKDDAARAAFIRSHFDRDINDPFDYHLTINSGKMHLKAAARLLLLALQQH